ncbi:MAG: hypothetical protein IIB68_06035 [Proteobacteria bacterium]|nr:hypothetical protein [Pseudomonadota bacterium]
MMDDTNNKNATKGVITRLFGVILIILGILNTMLAWRGGFAVSDLYIAFISFGVFVYLIGAVQRGSKS